MAAVVGHLLRGQVLLVGMVRAAQAAVVAAADMSLALALAAVVAMAIAVLSHCSEV